MIILNEILPKINLHQTRLLNAYIFGSRVYGNASQESDYDLLLIAKTPSPEREINIDRLNIHILTIDRFSEGLKQHNIRNIECLMSPDWAILKNDISIEFNLNINSLRHSISHINSNSWVKCKKKLNQGDYYIGIKSIWHSMRIAMFGTQIAKTGKIYDFTCANYLWDEITSKVWSWDELDKTYKKLNNSLMSDFRKFASK